MSAQTIEAILARWNSGDGKPYKGELIEIGRASCRERVSSEV